MLASRLTGLLPPLTEHEALESGGRQPAAPYPRRPAMAPEAVSRTASQCIDGGIGRRRLCPPGEISMAHNGVLFLDELPEFERKVLDALREPLESGEIVISRANARSVSPPECS